MDFDKAKLFIGGISRDTSEDALRVHFSRYGDVAGSLVARDKTTKIPRGFGFVWFYDPSFADRALRETHVIMGRTKHSEIDRNSSSVSSNNISVRTKKIFVGGLSADLTQAQFRNYFERFGKIVDVVVMQDSSTNRPRGFGFVTFDAEESVNKVMLNPFHELNGRQVEVKRAVPRDEVTINRNNALGRENTKGGSSSRTSDQGMLQSYSYGSGYQLYPTYAPVSAYMGGYPYGTGLYSSGYPVFGYGRGGYGIAPMATGSPWSGPLMAGTSFSPYLYPAYPNGGYADLSSMVLGGTGHQLSHMVAPQVEGVALQVQSLSLKDGAAGSASS
ncbi:unnamed protein product [Linum tenue]|uniref:RRM domain-containing protein n=1 Tax=Linum tenue TaxID=586396 RepID=A0AAV0P0R7_9ROSI|nr:unnamed protein product [Linum tenue]